MKHDKTFRMTKARRLDNSEWPNWLLAAWQKPLTEPGAMFCASDGSLEGEEATPLFIQSPTGTLKVAWGDLIVRGDAGQLNLRKVIGHDEPCPCGSNKKYKKCCYLKENKPVDLGAPVLSPSESVFGVLAWLTGLQTPLTLGARCDASKAVAAAALFCRVNNLDEPGSLDAVIMPMEPISEVGGLGAADIRSPLTKYVTKLECMAATVISTVDAAVLNNWSISAATLRGLKKDAVAALQDADPEPMVHEPEEAAE